MWAYESVFYQIYPIGFCGAPLENDGVCVPRIRKLIDWADYLADLGVGCVLLNPLFESDKHGYDTRDYHKLDCRLGTNDDLKDVCQCFHEHGIKVILDGVFNHVGRGFWAFQDVLENKEDSPYADWFHIDFSGNSSYDDGFDYEGWEGYFNLVKLNLNNPVVVDYLLDCVRSWIDTFDIDGLRLDVAYNLEPEFMKRLRAFTQAYKPDFFLVGEVMFGDYNEFVNENMLQSCTNYECYKGIYSSFNCMNLYEINYSLNRQFAPDPASIYPDMHLLSFVDNHDVTRIASILENKEHIRGAFGILFGMPGIPCLYYGSEWGAEGVKKKDFDYPVRPCFDAPAPNELTDYIRKLIQIRKNSSALCYGTYRMIVIDNPQLIFERRSGDDRVLVVINASDYTYTAYQEELTGTMTNLLTGETMTLNGQLDMPPYCVMYLQ